MITLAATKRLALVCCTAMIGLSAVEASAQAPIPRRPSAVNRPALSPYLELLRERTGPLPQFQQFYRPRVEQQQRQFRARQQVAQIQRRLGNQQRQIFASQGVRATGIVGGHMIFLHFYPSAGGF